jgi:hypothetical protein
MIALRTCLVFALLATASSSAPAAEPQNSETQATQELPEATPENQADSQDDTRPSASLDVTAASKYLFQGLDYSDGKAVLQPNLAGTFAKVSAVVWSNYQPDLNVVNEVDLSLKYSGTVRKLSISPGYTYLVYPNRDWDPSQELFLDIGLEAPLGPSISLHYDFDAGRGLYATLGVSHELKAPVTVGANLFYQGRYYEMTGFPAAELKLSGAWSIGPVSLTPQISHFFTWDNRDFRDEAGVPSTWLFSLNASRSD